MSYIIGGGGGGGGLTEDEVKTLIGRGKPSGTAGLNAYSDLEIPTTTAIFNPSPADIILKSNNELAIKVARIAPNTYDARVVRGGIERKLLDSTDRNRAVSAGVAGIYNPCKTILNEHRPVCTKEYHLVGKYLDGADNPDVWFPIKGAGANAAITYANRVLTLDSGSGAVSASRCVIDQTKFPITSNFLEVTCEIGNFTPGEGGERRIAIGFQPAFNESYSGNRAIVILDGNGNWGFSGRYTSNITLATACPIGRNLHAGDIVTVRLDRQEGSSNIDIVRFYVNGQKQFEHIGVPTSDVYAGIGAFNSNSLVDEGCVIGIKYFGVRYVP